VDHGRGPALSRPALVDVVAAASVQRHGRGCGGEWVDVPRRRHGDSSVPGFGCAGGVRRAGRRWRADVGRAGGGHEPVVGGRLRAGQAGVDRRRVAVPSQGRGTAAVHCGLPRRLDGMVGAGSTERGAGARQGVASSTPAAGSWSTVDDGSGERRTPGRGAVRAARGRYHRRQRQTGAGVERARDRRGRRDASPAPADLRRGRADRDRKRSIGPGTSAE